MTFRLREADLGDADLGAITAIVNETDPDDPTSIDEMRWSSGAYPGSTRFIVESDGRAVGTAGSAGSTCCRRTSTGSGDDPTSWPRPAGRASARPC